MEPTTTPASATLQILGMDWDVLLGKAVFLAVVIVIAMVVQHFAMKVTNRLLNRAQALPQASIITNILRVVIWVLALLSVLEPVFGVTPTAFLAGLGVGSIVISFGLKDTISNIIAGLGLMVSKVVTPGDYVTIAGITGTVKDVTWRHTIVINRLDEYVVIPNSILNTSSVVRLPLASESTCTVDFTMEPGREPDAVSADIAAAVRDAVGDRLAEGTEPVVRLSSITPYGIQGQVSVNVVEGVPFGGVRDDIVRAIACKPYFSTLTPEQAQVVAPPNA